MQQSKAQTICRQDRGKCLGYLPIDLTTIPVSGWAIWKFAALL